MLDDSNLFDWFKNYISVVDRLGFSHICGAALGLSHSTRSQRSQIVFFSEWINIICTFCLLFYQFNISIRISYMLSQKFVFLRAINQSISITHITVIFYFDPLIYDGRKNRKLRLNVSFDCFFFLLNKLNKKYLVFIA